MLSHGGHRMATGDIATQTAPKRRFEFTACGPSAKISREALQEVVLIYCAALLLRLDAKIWSRLETKGELTPTGNLLFAAGGVLLVAFATFLFRRMMRRHDYWPVFLAGTIVFASFFRFDKAPLAAGTALEKPLILLPILPAALASWAFLAMIREADELERRINYQALAFAFVVTFSACLAWSLLEDLGLPQISSFYWWLLLAISWGVGLTLSSRKYR
jgi:hypothetical protein